MSVKIRAGETETVTAYRQFGTDVHSASAVQVGVGGYDAEPASWVSPTVPASFSADGKTVTVTVTLGNGAELNSTGKVYLWVKVISAPQTLIERLLPDSYLFTDTGGNPPTTNRPYAESVSVNGGTQVTPDEDGNIDLAVAGGTGAVDSVNGQTGVVVLGAADVGADTASARDTAISTAVAVEVTRADAAYDAAGDATAAQTAAEAASNNYTDTAISSEVTRADAAYDTASARDAAIAAQHTTDVGLFDALGAAAAAQAAAIAASQPLDSDLTAIAALSTTSFGRSLLTQADAAALRTTAGLGTAATHPSTDFDAAGAAAAAQAASQPLDADLTAIAALTTTAFGRSFLALADAAAGRTLLGLGTLATQSGTFSGTSSGTNTGDQTIPTALPPNGAAGGDLSGTYPNPGVAKINGTALSGLATGVLKNTTTTGIPSIATAADVPTVAAGSTGPLSATDATTTNSRTPTAHASTHASAGSDAVTIAESQVTNLTTDLAAKAPLASPTFTGTPAAPTATAGTNTTQVATTAFVTTAVAGGGGSTKIPLSAPANSSYGLMLPLYHYTAVASGFVPATGTVYLYEFEMDQSCHVTGWDIWVNTAGTTGAKLYAAIYSAASDGSPGTLLSALGTGLAADSGGGIKSVTGLTVAVAAGRYFAALCGNPVNSLQCGQVNCANRATSLQSVNVASAQGLLNATVASAMTGTSWNSSLGTISQQTSANAPYFRLDLSA